MALSTFITRVAGRLTEIIPIVDSRGTTDGNKVVQTDATGRLDPTLMPIGVAPDIIIVPVTEAVSQGDLINLYDDGEGLKARKADGSIVGKECDGWAYNSAANGEEVTVYSEGKITDQSLSRGARYYLSDVAGEITTTPLSGAGKVHQYIGKAVSDSELFFEPDDGITLAQ